MKILICVTSFFLVFCMITAHWAYSHDFSNIFQPVGKDSLFFKCAAQDFFGFSGG